MKSLKTLFNFYINASIHVALSVYALVRITESYFNLPYNAILDSFIFYASISGYNFIKYASIVRLRYRDLPIRLKSIQIFSFFCFLFACYYGVQISFNTLLFFIPFGLFTLFYTTPFLSGFTKNLRSVGYIKIGIIALVWSGVTVILPLVDSQKTIDLRIFLLFFQRFLLIIVLTIPFDIRDYKFDNYSLKTLPQLLGVETTKKVGYILLSFSLLLEFSITANFYTKNAFLIIFFLLLFLLIKSSGEQSRYYSSFWVEAVPIFWGVLLWLN